MLIIQKRKLHFSTTKHCREQFSIKSGYYIVPTPSTALVFSIRSFNVSIKFNSYPMYSIILLQFHQNNQILMNGPFYSIKWMAYKQVLEVAYKTAMKNKTRKFI